MPDPPEPIITFRTLPLRGSPQAQLSAPQPEPDAPARPTTPYPLPADADTAEQHWQAIRQNGAPLDPHRAYLLHLVTAGLNAGLIYSVHLRDWVSAQLGNLLSDEVRRADAARRTPHGGLIGLDIHLAREHLRHAAQQRAADDAAGRVRPHVGLHLGPLIWHDGKRSTSCVITAVDGARVTLTGRRGRAEVSVQVDAAYLQAAVLRTRAARRGR